MDITRKSDDSGDRWYTNADGDRHMSVTSILNRLEEDTSGLDWWKSQNDGSGDAPYHQHLYWYSAPRGTLCHYQALKKLDEGFDGELYGDEERHAQKQLADGPQDEDLIEEWNEADVPTDTDAITYSVLKNQGTVSSRDQYEALFDNVTLEDVCRKDCEWFVDAFDTVCDELGISNETVIAVERFLLNTDDMYGGQSDLLYEGPDGATVLADLKTSSGLRQKHRLQSVAYGKAIEKDESIDVDDVDRLEVIRIAPDKKDVVVHSHLTPEFTSDVGIEYTDDYWFEDEYGDFEYESLEDMWEKFTDLSKKAHDDI
jgi:hypothetical protein